MGTFSLEFLGAARIAGEVLGEGSLSARHHGLPHGRVLAMGSKDARPRWGEATSPELAALCSELAGTSEGNRQAVNGTEIERASILTKSRDSRCDTLPR